MLVYEFSFPVNSCSVVCSVFSLLLVMIQCKMWNDVEMLIFFSLTMWLWQFSVSYEKLNHSMLQCLLRLSLYTVCKCIDQSGFSGITSTNNVDQFSFPVIAAMLHILPTLIVLFLPFFSSFGRRYNVKCGFGSSGLSLNLQINKNDY